MGIITVNKEEKKEILGRGTNSKSRNTKNGVYQGVVASPILLEKSVIKRKAVRGNIRQLDMDRV